jgi:steroid delta-isomerase
MPTPEQVRDAVDAYVGAINKGDRQAWLDSFAHDATQIDPVPSPANVGRENIGAFWDRMIGTAESVTFDLRQLHVCGDQAAVVWAITARAGGGGMEFDGVDIFQIDDNGLIASVTAYWDPAQMRTAEA